MQELRIDISGNKTKSVFDIHKAGKNYDFVITVCDTTSAEKCPVFPGTSKTIHWNINDPSEVTGTHAEKLDKVRIIRGNIMAKIQIWLDEVILSYDF